MPTLHELAEPWLRADDDARIGDLLEQVGWLGQRLYRDYEPYEYETFTERLSAWIAQLEDDNERKHLFGLLDQLFFVGRREFESLCRAAFNGAIVRWLIDCLELPIDAPDLDASLAEALRRTWFCPVTDSMRINAFLKVNRLTGQSHRPDWRSLAVFAKQADVSDYMKSKKLERIVLLEDFVGSGTQLVEPVNFAASISKSVPVLVSPLVCCPKGLEIGVALAAKHKNVSFSPVMDLAEKLLLRPDASPEEPANFEAVRDLVQRHKGKLSPSNWDQPFGYKNTGALVVMYSNCPDNTLPIIHDDRGEWSALFPRIERE